MARRSGRFKAVVEVDDNIELEGMLIKDHFLFPSSVIYKAMRWDGTNDLDQLDNSHEDGEEGKSAIGPFLLVEL